MFLINHNEGFIWIHWHLIGFFRSQRSFHSIRRNRNTFSFQLNINKPLCLGSTSAWKSQSLVGWSSPALHSLKPVISAVRWPLLGLHVLFSPCHHALFISLRPLSVTNTAMQQLACTTLRPRDLMSALSPAVYFQSWDTLYHFNGKWNECVCVCLVYSVFCLCTYVLVCLLINSQLAPCLQAKHYQCLIQGQQWKWLHPYMTFYMVVTHWLAACSIYPWNVFSSWRGLLPLSLVLLMFFFSFISIFMQLLHPSLQLHPDCLNCPVHI